MEPETVSEKPSRRYPSETVEIAIVSRTYAAFGRIPTVTVSDHSCRIHVLADMGAQTCSSRTEIWRILRFSNGHLVPTTRQTHDITNNQLHVKGVLFMRRRVGSRETRQAVYVEYNMPDLYLSQTALKYLNLLLDRRLQIKGHQAPFNFYQRKPTVSNWNNG